MKIIYAFPEPLPLDRARGLQAINTVAALAAGGSEVVLAQVPGASDPFVHYGVNKGPGVAQVAVSRNLPWPLSRVHSNRLFFANLRRQFGSELRRSLLFVRHLKLAGLVARHLPGVAMVYEAHEVFADTASPGRRAAIRRLEGLVMTQARAVVANSSATAMRLQALYGRKGIEVIPNGVEWPDRLPDKPWAEAHLSIIYAGSFFPWKGVAELIAASRQLGGFRITLIGAAEDHAALGGRTAEGAELILPGRLPHAQVMSRLGQACIAILPNRDDADSAFTSPIKLFEYMASGCAIVASDLPSIREILAPDEAEWVQPGDPASLAAGIRKLAGDPERARRLGGRVREKARQYTWNARGDRLNRLLRSLGSE